MDVEKKVSYVKRRTQTEGVLRAGCRGEYVDLRGMK
jgi:hypothetical protein